MDVQTKWTHRFGLDTDPISYETCYSPEFFAKEKEKIFKKSWIKVGRVSDIPRVGDYFVKDVPSCDTSIIVVRGRDNQIRAFHNMCPHRGNKVAAHISKDYLKDYQDNAKNFVCTFHGWSFGLDGKLSHIPDEGSFFNLDKSKCGLAPVAVDTWLGIVFINVDPNPKESLKDSLGELYDGLAGYPIDKMVKIATMRTVLNCNWKIFLDAFQEAYHVLELHRRSAPEAFFAETNPLGHLNAIRVYGKHHTLSAWGNPSQKPTPATVLEAKYQMMATYAPTAGERFEGAQKGDKWASFPPLVNADRRDDWAFDIHTIFPHMNFYTAPGWAVLSTYEPLDVDKTINNAEMYVFEPESVASYIGFEHTKAMVYDVGLEDLSTVERIQSMLKSGAFSHMIVSDQETAVRHLHRVIETIVNSED